MYLLGHFYSQKTQMLRISSPGVRDIDEAYTLSLERGPTWRIWVPLNARKLSFFCFLALRLVSRVDYTFC